jgi:hypothetical protein
MPRAVLGSTREVGLNDRSRARLLRRSLFNSHAMWFPMRIWENELGSKSPRMLNLKHFLENKSVQLLNQACQNFPPSLCWSSPLSATIESESRTEDRCAMS